MLRRSLIERLVHYYRCLSGERPAAQRSDYISSAEVAGRLDIDPTQVRRDLAAIGRRGFPRLGFRVEDTRRSIAEVLGFDQQHRAVLIGAGRLGRALAAYPGFADYGLEVVGVFDVDPARREVPCECGSILPMGRLGEVVRAEEAALAILTVPASAAQPVADAVVAAGVRAIWNFAPRHLDVPEGVLVRSEHISVGLGEIAYHLRHVADE